MERQYDIASRLKESKRRGRIGLIFALSVAGAFILLAGGGYFEALAKTSSPVESIIIAFTLVIGLAVVERKIGRYVCAPVGELTCSRCGLKLARVINLRELIREKRDLRFCPSCGTNPSFPQIAKETKLRSGRGTNSPGEGLSRSDSSLSRLSSL